MAGRGLSRAACSLLSALHGPGGVSSSRRLLGALAVDPSSSSLSSLSLPEQPSSSSSRLASFASAAASRGFSSQQSLEHEFGSGPQSSFFSDLAAARRLLPHRASYSLSFSAHGVQLVPEGAASTDGAASAAELEQAGKIIECLCRVGTMGEEEEDEEEGLPGGLHAIGIKTWRRLKMKKHKIRKRRKANRHKAK